jgi:acyl-CoA thioester hydrolase
MARETPLTRAAFPHIAEITTRWMDNDVYGHVNNVVYYSFFDTVVNGYLVAQNVLNIGALDKPGSEVIGLVVETRCNYFKPVAFPDLVSAGLRVEHIGTSSVRYGIGLFRNDDKDAAAQGHFVHVYVERKTNKPVALPEKLKSVLEVLK